MRKLAELAKSSSGHKRMRLDTAAAQQQLKQLLQQEQADSEQPSDAVQQADGVHVKQEQQEQSTLDAAAAADGIKLEPAAAGEQQDPNAPLEGVSVVVAYVVKPVGSRQGMCCWMRSMRCPPWSACCLCWQSLIHLQPGPNHILAWRATQCRHHVPICIIEPHK